MRPVAVVDTVLVGLNVDAQRREAIAGDLIEEHALMAAACGERSANRWLRFQIIRSVPQFMRASVRDGGLRLVAAMVAAALAALVAVSVVIGALSTVVSSESIARVAIVALAIDLGCGVAGGYLAARLGRAAPLGAAFAFGVLGVTASRILGGAAHGWYEIALQILLIPATVSGGWLRASHLVRRSHSA